MAELDRRIWVLLNAYGDRDSFGRYQPGATTAYALWAKRIDNEQIEARHTKDSSTGVIHVTKQIFRTRFDPTIYWHDIAAGTLILQRIPGGNIEVLDVDSVSEDTAAGRRRFMMLTGTRVREDRKSGGFTLDGSGYLIDAQNRRVTDSAGSEVQP